MAAEEQGNTFNDPYWSAFDEDMDDIGEEDEPAARRARTQKLQDARRQYLNVKKAETTLKPSVGSSLAAFRSNVASKPRSEREFGWRRPSLNDGQQMHVELAPQVLVLNDLISSAASVDKSFVWEKHFDSLQAPTPRDSPLAGDLAVIRGLHVHQH